MLANEAVRFAGPGSFVSSTHREEKGKKRTGNTRTSGAATNVSDGRSGCLEHTTTNVRPQRLNEGRRRISLVNERRAGHEQMVKRRSKYFPSFSRSVEEPSGGIDKGDGRQGGGLGKPHLYR